MANVHTSREAWLQDATDRLRTRFAAVGTELPAAIRFAIAFPSTGMRSKRVGECWHSEASADGHVEIIIRSDQSDPVEVLSILAHELVHAGVGSGHGHGKVFKRTAVAVGLTGPMRSTIASPKLRDDLAQLAEAIGPLPHGKLGFGSSSDTPKKQDTRLLKVECLGCGYLARTSRKWIEAAGPPWCPLCPEHAPMACDVPIEELELA